MRETNTILGLIHERGKKGLPLERVHRLMYNSSLYLTAYGKMYRNKGAMTEGVTDETVEGMSLDKIEMIIKALRDDHLDGNQSDECTFQRKMENCARSDYQTGRISWCKKSCGYCSTLIMNPSSATTHTDSDRNEDVTRPYGRSRDGMGRQGS